MWSPGPGVIELPSGLTVRGRSLRAGVPAGTSPDFAVYLRGQSPEVTDWSSIWLRWPDFWVPLDGSDARQVIGELYARLADRRCEVACGGGVGRTGSVLAALAVLDGLEPDAAIGLIRERYHPRAVEMPWQRRWVAMVASRG